MRIDLNNKKILIMIPSGLGDFVKSLGIFLSIKQQYSVKTLDVVVTEEGVNVLKGFVSYIDNVIIMNIRKFTFCNYLLYFLFKGWSDIKKINSQKYDLIICLTINPLRKYLLTFINVKSKIILSIGGTDVIKEYEFISTLGVDIVQHQSAFFDKFNNLEKLTPLSMFLQDKKNILINMFCANSPNSVREWRKWGELIDKISNKFNIFLIGRVDFDYKKYYSLDYSRVVDLINKVDLKSLVFLFKKSDLVVTVDSFPFHLAYAVGTPVIGLFGPVDPETRIPVSVDRKNIHYLYNNKKIKLLLENKLKKELKKNNDIYIKDISVEDVISAINNIFK
jgi:ADP-heptose:LPS heptosyltransferase